MGVPLHRIKELRVLYGEDPWGETPIDFEGPKNIPEPRGHVIAARITSENPDEVRSTNKLGLFLITHNRKRRTFISYRYAICVNVQMQLQHRQ